MSKIRNVKHLNVKIERKKSSPNKTITLEVGYNIQCLKRQAYITFVVKKQVIIATNIQMGVLRSSFLFCQTPCLAHGRPQLRCSLYSIHVRIKQLSTELYIAGLKCNINTILGHHNF